MNLCIYVFSVDCSVLSLKKKNKNVANSANPLVQLKCVSCHLVGFPLPDLQEMAR